jgi:hypothetical protein
MKKSLLMILFAVASTYAQDATAQKQAAAAKTTADSKTAKTDQTTKRTQNSASASSSQASFGIASSIPKDAQALDQGRYRAIDADGVAWVYQRTPFGITKSRESDLQKLKADKNSPFGGPMKTKEASPSQDNSTAATVTAFPNGDEIRFEKQTPFGKSAWTKKRTEQLNSMEKNALANAEKTTASNGKN